VTEQAITEQNILNISKILDTQSITRKETDPDTYHLLRQVQI